MGALGSTRRGGAGASKRRGIGSFSLVEVARGGGAEGSTRFFGGAAITGFGGAALTDFEGGGVVVRDLL